jgi:NADPH:quinone reductase-like Zn-dependent oxidoreductase
VFGGTSSGAFAEYVCVGQTVVTKSANLTFEQAAAVPTAAVTACRASATTDGYGQGTQC